MTRLMMLATTVAAILLHSASSEAALVSGFAGNTRPNNPGGQDGSISFAVFDLAGGSAGDAFGTGFAGFDSFFAPGTSSPALNTSAGTYLYLYQIVNDGTVDEIIDNLTVRLNGHPLSSVTSWGWFGGLGFLDNGVLVGDDEPLGNNGPFVDSPPAARAPADTSGTLSGPYVAALSDGVVPAAVSLSGSGAFTSFKADFSETMVLGPSSVPGGSVSILVGFTSKLAPAFANASIQNGTSVNGTVASVAPAPSALVMLMSVLPVLLGCAVFGKRFGLVPNLQSFGAAA